ncbi:flagellar biosynthetic protein FlhB [Breoghania corrubedonensis]|uniref:Flagellar biosynthetic protein FlhB n=1 Tax=Breoghania corrubedonensis TaxID=665038 RepID=A0A2T5VDE2_9HYPH|nr:flagellar biosynthesis protein FlhB [Breoghania corrubedonensis]PTW61762.1 flagellar biosynthetic protein FlhB [Breoghania corrubedonensis]
MSDADQSEKTEDPTQKKLDDALKRGDVAKSQEVSTWFSLVGAALIVAIFAPSIAGTLGRGMAGILANSWEIPVDTGGMRKLFLSSGMMIFAAVGLPFLCLVILALAGNLVQHRFVWSGENMKPKLSKVSPLSGAKRIFSKDSLVNFTKGLIKIAAVGTLMFAVLWPMRDELDTMVMRDVVMILPETREISLQLLGAIIALMAAVAAGDFLWQRHKWYERQKMTVQEVKDEYKQSEGDPMVKGRIRQIRMERSRKRMMAAVPSATVVVTNPTHYAVALKYEDGMQAPLCVAKGSDQVALKIREIAKANDIPIIENPPLARTLHAQIEVDQEIPEEHYRAVAEVIGYVLRQRNTKSWRDR